jgi:hypothetical protein
LGFSLKDGSLLIIACDAASDHDGVVDAGRYHLCGNLYVVECNWPLGPTMADATMSSAPARVRDQPGQ